MEFKLRREDSEDRSRGWKTMSIVGSSVTELNVLVATNRRGSDLSANFYTELSWPLIKFSFMNIPVR